MTADDLSARYRAYIACLNARDWDGLADFVANDARYNGEAVGLSGFRAMLQGNYRDIPDLQFDVDLLVCDRPYIARRLKFDCTPVAAFLGLAVNGRRMSFTENLFYRLCDGRIDEVWSIVDKAAIEAQIEST